MMQINDSFYSGFCAALQMLLWILKAYPGINTKRAILLCQDAAGYQDRKATHDATISTANANSNPIAALHIPQRNTLPARRLAK
jgi:hypothetical protein